MNSTKRILPLVLTALVSALIFGALGYSLANTNPTTPTAKPSATASATPAAQTKLYTNTDHKFSFQYPSTWTVTDTVQTANAFATPQQALIFTNGATNLTVWVKPDGHGVPGSEIDYTMTYVNNQIVLSDRTVNTITNSDDNTFAIIKGNINFKSVTINGTEYYMYAKGVTTTELENTVKAIVTSFKKI